MSFTCKRCNSETHARIKRESICKTCEEDLDLLDKQLMVNKERIKKLEEHKKRTESDMKNLDSSNDRQTDSEMMRRIEKNLKIEYELHEGILKAINSKNEF